MIFEGAVPRSSPKKKEKKPYLQPRNAPPQPPARTERRTAHHTRSCDELGRGPAAGPAIRTRRHTMQSPVGRQTGGDQFCGVGFGWCFSRPSVAEKNTAFGPKKASTARNAGGVYIPTGFHLLVTLDSDIPVVTARPPANAWQSCEGLLLFQPAAPVVADLPPPGVRGGGVAGILGSVHLPFVPKDAIDQPGVHERSTMPCQSCRPSAEIIHPMPGMPLSLRRTRGAWVLASDEERAVPRKLTDLHRYPAVRACHRIASRLQAGCKQHPISMGLIQVGMSSRSFLDGGLMIAPC